jgi:hypothetical protein
MSQRAIGIGRKKKAVTKKRRVQPRKSPGLLSLAALKRDYEKQLDKVLRPAARKKRKPKASTKKVLQPKRRTRPMGRDDDEKKHAAKKPEKTGSEPDPMATPPDTPPALPGDAGEPATHEKK